MSLVSNFKDRSHPTNTSDRPSYVIHDNTRYIFKAEGNYGCPDSIRSIALGYSSRVCHIYLLQFSAWLIARRNKVNKVLLQASEMHDRHRGTLQHCLLDVVK